MNITKILAEEIANKMVQPLQDRIQNLKKILVSETEKVADENIDKNIIAIHQKYPSWINSTQQIVLCYGPENLYISVGKKYPEKVNTYGIYITVDEKTFTKIKKTKKEIENIFQKKKRIFDDILSNLVSLRSSKNVKENFPQAYEFLKEYEEQGNKVLALPIENIMKEIELYK